MKIQAIIAAGGLGARLKAMRPKPLVLLDGKPLLIYSLEVFEKSPLIDGIVVVIHESHVSEVEDIIRQCEFKKVVKVVVGGRTRCESVYNGLQAVDEKTSVVVVHDGARPFINPRTLYEAVMQGRTHEAVVVGVPVKPTIKRVNLQGMFVEETLKREELWEIQTPQIFKRAVLWEAHTRKTQASPAAGGEAPSDDAVLVERLGVKVKVVCGDYDNIKITTKEDLMIAEAFLKNRSQEDLSADRQA
jgi:2-C-methyl-D-erythritol 4-phosphate cytidylyltransferase